MRKEFTDYDLGYEAGYRKAMRDYKEEDYSSEEIKEEYLEEGLEIEEPKLINITYNNELFRSMVYNKIKKKAKYFEFNEVERPEGFEDALPIGSTSNAEEEEDINFYYFVSKKDPGVNYIIFLGNDDFEPVYRVTVLGIRHLKDEVREFKSITKMITYVCNVEKIVDEVEDEED